MREKDNIIVYIKTELESSQNKNKQILEVSNSEIKEIQAQYSKSQAESLDLAKKLMEMKDLLNIVPDEFIYDSKLMMPELKIIDGISTVEKMNDSGERTSVSCSPGLERAKNIHTIKIRSGVNNHPNNRVLIGFT